MQKLMFIAFGGVAGTLLRYFLSDWVETKWPPVFPYGTLLVNLSGCLAAGVLFEVFERVTSYPELRLTLLTGFLGAFTTFSAYAVQTFDLGRSGAPRLAILNVVISTIAGLAAVWLGSEIGRRAI